MFLCFQIVECRRVLKWTYAYGYYLPEHEHAKRQFFEYLQGLCFLTLDAWHFIILPSSKFQLRLFEQVRPSLVWKDFINVQKRSYKFTSTQMDNQKISMSSAQNLLDWPGWCETKILVNFFLDVSLNEKLQFHWVLSDNHDEYYLIFLLVLLWCYKPRKWQVVSC